MDIDKTYMSLTFISVCKKIRDKITANLLNIYEIIKRRIYLPIVPSSSNLISGLNLESVGAHFPAVSSINSFNDNAKQVKLKYCKNKREFRKHILFC